jgi:hypothetical protein
VDTALMSEVVEMTGVIVRVTQGDNFQRRLTSIFKSTEPLALMGRLLILRELYFRKLCPWDSPL